MRHLNLSLLSALLVFTPLGIPAFQNCPFQSSDFPAPRNLTSYAAVQNATSCLKGAIEEGLFSGLFGPDTSSFAVEIFSSHDVEALFQYHYTAPLVANGSTGTRKVDSNSIFRIGSASKLITVYTFLIAAGHVRFEEPVTRYVPELRGFANATANRSSVAYVDWDKITIGDLATHLSGIGRDCKLLSKS